MRDSNNKPWGKVGLEVVDEVFHDDALTEEQRTAIGQAILQITAARGEHTRYALWHAASAIKSLMR